MSISRKLKYWRATPANQTAYRGCDNYIAAYTKKQAIELHALAGDIKSSSVPSWVSTQFNEQSQQDETPYSPDMNEPCCLVVNSKGLIIKKIKL